MRTDGHYPMKRSILAALLMVVLTAPAAYGQAKLLAPQPLGNDDKPTAAEPPQFPPAKTGNARLGPPTSLPIAVPFPAEVPATGPPHQLKGREPAHGTKTAGVPDPVPPKPPTAPMPTAMPEPDSGSHGRFWTQLDGFVGWVQGDRPPALVTGGPSGSTVLFGGREINDNAQAGFRLQAGYWFDSVPTMGIQAGGFWLDNANTSASFVSNGSTILARPFVDAASGKSSAEYVAYPGISSGSVIVGAHSSFDGWDIALRELACSGCNTQLNAVVGFRQMRLADQLGVGEESTVFGAGGPRGLPAGAQLLAQDHFDTLNDFYGADFGFEAEYRYRGWVIEGLVKLAVGWDVSQANINGESYVTLPNQPTVASPGGLLALPSNIGSYHHTDVTLIPELGVNVAYDLTDHVRLRGGYSFLYWENVTRPSSQIDTSINPNLVPPGAGGGPAKPTEAVAGNNLYVHGIIFGVEVRF